MKTRFASLALALLLLAIVLVVGCTSQPTPSSVTTTPGSEPTAQAVQPSAENAQQPSPQSAPQSAPSTPAVKEFTMTAKRWEFSPSTITVKKGDTVKLTIRSIDVEHGFGLTAFNIDENLEPGQDMVVQFVADKSGTFGFSCSVYCGSGHSGMEGKLIVEE